MYLSGSLNLNPITRYKVIISNKQVLFHHIATNRWDIVVPPNGNNSSYWNNGLELTSVAWDILNTPVSSPNTLLIIISSSCLGTVASVLLAIKMLDAVVNTFVVPPVCPSKSNLIGTYITTIIQKVGSTCKFICCCRTTNKCTCNVSN